MRRIQSAWWRGGAGAVALTAATLLSVPATAHAADPLPDLAVSATDLNTPGTRVGGGDRRPLRAEIRNAGSVPVSGLTYTVGVSEGATLAGDEAGCTYTDWFPESEGRPWAYGPSEATCTVARTLNPGEALPVRFTVSFGRNLWGPAQHYGYVSVAPPGEEGDADENNNYDDLSYWSRRNTHDVAVTAPAVRGAIGQTVDLGFEVVNYGPSDGGGPDVLVQAPRGTVLLPSEWCWTEGTPNEQLPESTRVRCNFESYFPTVHSGYGRVSHTIPLKIKSTPGRDGWVRADGEMTPGTESRWANNTARITVGVA
jgi:hypothetical protein